MVISATMCLQYISRERRQVNKDNARASPSFIDLPVAINRGSRGDQGASSKTILKKRLHHIYRIYVPLATSYISTTSFKRKLLLLLLT